MAKKNNITFIGEGGQGHEGKISYVKKYIRAASKSKFNFLKFHIIFADELATKNYAAAASLPMSDIVDWYLIHFERLLAKARK